ncbi:MAG: tyrosine-type recombinase/integrase [Halorientalis sp.]
MPSYKWYIHKSMATATKSDIEAIRERIRNPDPEDEGIDPEDYAEDRELLLEVSTVMGRYRTEWGHERHQSVLKRLIILSWGGTDTHGYTEDEIHDASLSAALEEREAAGEIVEWIHDTYTNEETNRDMRGALRTFGKVLANEDPTDKEASPPPSIDWIPATLPDNYDPVPNPANMIAWEEAKAMCEHPETNARDAALIAVAWDAGPRSGELKDLDVGDVSDHDLGRIIHVDGKQGERDVTITHAVPYLQQWLNQHPSGDPDDPLWTKLKDPDSFSESYFLRIFSDAADRVGLDKPYTPTNFRKSSASACASNGMNQATLEKRYGWKRGSDAAARYIRVFGEDADRELAKARNIDIDLEDDGSDGQTECERCGELVSTEAAQCWNCDFILDREAAQEEITTDTRNTDVETIVEEAVQDTVSEMMGPLADSEWQESTLRAVSIMKQNDDWEVPQADDDSDPDTEAIERAQELMEKLDSDG